MSKLYDPIRGLACAAGLYAAAVAFLIAFGGVALASGDEPRAPQCPTSGPPPACVYPGRPCYNPSNPTATCVLSLNKTNCTCD